MEQMQVSPEKIVSIDYHDQDLPLSVQQFEPMIFKEGDKFFVILGPNASDGIQGMSDTLKGALADWDTRLSSEIDNPREGNETTRFVLDNLNTF